MLKTLAPILPAVLILYTAALLAYGLRGGFRSGAALIREHRAAWLRHSLLGYGLFFGGLAVGLGVPALSAQLGDVGRQALGSIGLGALNSMLALTGGILVWNTLIGLLATNVLPGLVAGIPVIVINLGRCAALGVLLAQVEPVKLLAHLPTILIELQAYLLLSFAAWLWIRRTLPTLLPRLRQRVQWADLRRDAAELWTLLSRVLPLALLLLLIGAWYEGAELTWLIPALSGP